MAARRPCPSDGSAVPRPAVDCGSRGGLYVVMCMDASCAAPRAHATPSRDTRTRLRFRFRGTKVPPPPRGGRRCMQRPHSGIGNSSRSRVETASRRWKATRVECRSRAVPGHAVRIRLGPSRLAKALAMRTSGSATTVPDAAGSGWLTRTCTTEASSVSRLGPDAHVETCSVLRTERRGSPNR
jgi:hypothetical protein